jgi:hypothetical protein
MDATIKINRKGSAHWVGGNEFQGGVCGTCFTLSSGITISCDHIGRDLFRPIEGFDACRVFAANSATEATLLRQGCVRRHPEFDACVIDGYSSPITYSVSATPAADVSTCQLLGYTAALCLSRFRKAVITCRPSKDWIWTAWLNEFKLKLG